jgi:hypothetical protein
VRLPGYADDIIQMAIVTDFESAYRTCSRTGSIMTASLLAKSARMYVNVLDPESNSWRNSSGAGGLVASVTMLRAAAIAKLSAHDVSFRSLGHTKPAPAVSTRALACILSADVHCQMPFDAI